MLGEMGKVVSQLNLDWPGIDQTLPDFDQYLSEFDPIRLDIGGLRPQIGKASTNVCLTSTKYRTMPAQIGPNSTNLDKQWLGVGPIRLGVGQCGQPRKADR